MSVPYLAITHAEQIGPLQLRLTFNTGETREVDFAPFLKEHPNPLIRRYADPDHFARFRITDGDLEWDDFERCFPIIDLYENTLAAQGGVHAA